VGTELATSSDAPSHGAVYKLVELGTGAERRYTAKFSKDKATLPGSKQIFRYATRDVLARSHECFMPGCEALLRPVILNGEAVGPRPTAADSRAHARRSIERLPKKYRSLFECDPPYPIELSEELVELSRQVHRAAAAERGESA